MQGIAPWVKLILVIAVGVSLFEIGVIFGLSLPGMFYVPSEVEGFPAFTGEITPDFIIDAPMTIHNLSEINDLVTDYGNTHAYYEHIYDCDQMASDLWNQLTAKGINAKLMIGNIMQDMFQTDDINHAWAMAEVAPGRWVALEATSRPGRIVFVTDNPRYYRGILFDNPAEMQFFLDHFAPGGDWRFINMTPLQEPWKY